MNVAEAKIRLAIPGLWEKLQLPGEPGSSCHSPFREDRRPSFWVSEDGQRYHDHGEGEGGDAVDFLQRATGLPSAAACRKFIALAQNEPIGVQVPPAFASGGAGREKVPGAGRREKPLGRVLNLPKFVGDLTTPYERGLRTTLAKTRHLREDGLRLAHGRGLLAFTFHKQKGYRDGLEYYPTSSEPVWVVTDRTRYNVQMRWLDGSTWEDLKGAPKAKNWPGSCGRWPIGIQEARAYPLIVLVEGGPDLLAAHHFAELTGVEEEVGVVGMMGAGMTIHPEALPLFAGKRVRIIPDADDPGRAAAERWGRQLREAGAEVDAFRLEGLQQAGGAPVKDLNDCCLIDPDDAGQLEGLLVT